MSSNQIRDSSSRRVRNFALVLYPQEDETHRACLDMLQMLDACWITHDCDRLDDGAVKKSHVHAIVQLADACTISALASRLGITANYIEPVRNLKQAKRYLVHKDDPDKYQYPVDSVLGALSSSVVECVTADDKPTEDELACAVLDYIDGFDGVVTMSLVMRWALNNGCYSALRRGATLYREVMREHNNMYYNDMPMRESADVTMARFGGYVMGVEDARKERKNERVWGD